MNQQSGHSTWPTPEKTPSNTGHVDQSSVECEQTAFASSSILSGQSAPSLKTELIMIAQ